MIVAVIVAAPFVWIRDGVVGLWRNARGAPAAAAAGPPAPVPAATANQHNNLDERKINN